MDRKKLENRLYEWSRQLRFTLPDGSFPQSSTFSLLVTTPNTFHLWQKILEKVEARDRVLTVRKQILVAKVKSDGKPECLQEQILNLRSAGIHRKVELWKKRRALEKMIIEKRKEVDELRDDAYKKAQSIQSECCKLAGIEKNHSDLKEKVLLSSLLMDNHKDNIEKYKEQIMKIKSYANNKSGNCMDNFEKHKILEKVRMIEEKMIENLDKKIWKMEGKDTNEITELITDKNSLSKLWDVIIDIKIENIKDYTLKIDDNEEGNEAVKEEESLKAREERFMLDITEYSLETILNRKLEKVENLKLKQIVSNIDKLMFNKSISRASQLDISYIQPNETGDSLTGRREKMSNFMKALSHYGLKKQNEFLKREIEKICKENKKNEHWTTEKEKFEVEALKSFETLESRKREVEEFLRVDKSSVHGVVKSHSEYALLVRDAKKDLNEGKVFDAMAGFVADIKKGSENLIELVSDMCLDVFRRIHISPGKEVYEYESLHHCLDHYGGELRDFFSTYLVSPYDKPEVILSKIEERKAFLLYIKDVVEKGEKDLKNSEMRFAQESGEKMNLEGVERNHKETVRVLSKVIARLENMEKDMDLARDVLKSWLEQPYRLMIPDTITVNSMTLRQFEEKFKTVESELKYYTELNQRANRR